MSKRMHSSRPDGQSGGGGFRSRSGAAGFLVSLKSLIWPAGSQPEAPERPRPQIRTGPLRSLPAMPRAANARPAPGASQASSEAHPLRRVAGSAGRWKKRLDEARKTWSRATVDELIATDGHVQKLASLVQARYGLSQEAAEAQVRAFLGSRDAG